MNRTGEYVNFIRTSAYDGSSAKNRKEENVHAQQEGNQKNFYDCVYQKIQDFNTNVATYTSLLKKEQEFNKLQRETVDLFKVIDLESNNDLKMHFEGIKKIIMTKLADKSADIQAKKRRFINKNIHLEPEKPFVYLNAHHDKNLEMENKMIMKETHSLDYQMKQTRKSLQEIKHIQDQISLNLNVQNESIDQIFNKSKSINENVKGGNKYLKMGKEKKRLLRRALFIWLLCISFILVFLHWNY
ncbi:SNARE protein Syntaxin 18/UFE1 [Trachipleistophora hominis]|uniref:SNARE protein Syntaxin 18/UFE1 n=1 Tax=Trachipleistophora hominis TaxID=72359 RepID=L7K069_TRAHO|nr:SNARE protein Syntaxin 18/UFE1 [Trachipleistophora hominis]